MLDLLWGKKKYFLYEKKTNGDIDLKIELHKDIIFMYIWIQTVLDYKHTTYIFPFHWKSRIKIFMFPNNILTIEALKVSLVSFIFPQSKNDQNQKKTRQTIFQVLNLQPVYKKIYYSTWENKEKDENM